MTYKSTQWLIQEKFGGSHRVKEWETLEYAGKRRFKRIREAVLKLDKKHRLQNKNIIKILDVGCDDGLLLQPFVNVYKIYGMDLNIENLKLANIRGYRTFRYDLEKLKYKQLPFANNYFDIIICSEVVEHILDTDILFKELHRVCKSYLIITVPNVNSCFNLYTWLVDLPPMYSARYRSSHVRDFTKKTITTALENNSFLIEEITGFSEVQLNSGVSKFLVYGVIEKIFEKIPRLADKILVISKVLK